MMYAVIGRSIRGLFVAITQPSKSEAEWYRSHYTHRFAGTEYVVCPFATYVDQKRSSGENPYPMREDFDFDAHVVKVVE